MAGGRIQNQDGANQDGANQDGANQDGVNDDDPNAYDANQNDANQNDVNAYDANQNDANAYDANHNDENQNGANQEEIDDANQSASDMLLGANQEIEPLPITDPQKIRNKLFLPESKLSEDFKTTITDTWRFCLDYRKSNDYTKSASWPMPNVQQ